MESWAKDALISRGAKKVSESAIDNYPYTLFPNDLNCYKSVFGGRLLEIADRLAGTVANMHSGRACVTLGLDNVRFKNPAREGEILIFKSAVNRVWKTSMEVGVRVITKNPENGSESHIISMYFTFVAVDQSSCPQAVVPVVPETDAENRRFEEAGRRRKLRLEEEGRKNG